jgi:hypothetical protein
MSIYNFGTTVAHVQALWPHESTYGTFRLFNVVKPERAEGFDNPKDTMMGYVTLAEDETISSYKMFLDTQFPHIKVAANAYVIQRLLRVEYITDFNEVLPDVEARSEAVLIDSDYISEGHPFAAQICLTNFSSEFNSQYNKRMPDLVFEFQVITPPSPENAVSFVYGTPLFAAMRPSDSEEFLDANLFKLFVVPDFVFVKSTKGANGFDIAPRAIVDNCKDFDDNTLEHAVSKRIKIPAKYSVTIVFPKFFVHYGEFNHMPNQFILRSRVSKMNMVLEYSYVASQDLVFTLTNCNSFDVFMVEDPCYPNEIPFRFCQFVPSAELTYKLSTFEDPDEMARFMGIILVLNEKKRKSKF